MFKKYIFKIPCIPGYQKMLMYKYLLRDNPDNSNNKFSCYCWDVFKYLCVLPDLICLFYMYLRSALKFHILSRDRSPNMGIQGKSIFGGPLTPNQELRLVDWLEHSCKLVSWVRFNGFMLTQQWTTNIACILGIVHVFNLIYNLKTK